ncbi:MAG: 50S ribosomal protein L22 [Flavobacteriales bacterium]|nr:MAG: 50S ribosomal protein L22 [Flavobacteriales bacterium]
MGARKRLSAEKRKAALKQRVIARLNDVPTSPRKMRLVADVIRGMDADKALFTLKNSPQHAALRLEKLLLSALDNWRQKNEDARLEEAGLYIKEIQVNGGRMLKRIQPAPQGRAHRIRKRSNHVILELGSRTAVEVDTNINEETTA